MTEQTSQPDVAAVFAIEEADASVLKAEDIEAAKVAGIDLEKEAREGGSNPVSHAEAHRIKADGMPGSSAFKGGETK